MNTKDLQIAVKMIKEKKLDQATKILNKILQSDKKNQTALQLMGEVYKQSEELEKSSQFFKKAALLGGKHSALCWYNAGVIFQRINNATEAIQCYKNALEAMPDHLSTRNNLAVVLQNSNRIKDALPHAWWLLEHATAAEHIINAGYILRSNDYHDDADRAFKKALACDPTNRRSISAAIQSAQYVCDWDTLESLIKILIEEDYQNGLFSETKELHHVHIAWCDNERINAEVTKVLTDRYIGDIKPIFDHSPKIEMQKIRIGYVSSDFFNHATLHLIVGVLEQHDKNKFEIYGYCHSNNDSSLYRNRFKSAIDHFRDISQLTDDAAAKLINKDKIDILVDLKGFTDKNRLKIFALRPAPIQVTYIGFPGSSCANFFDYVITDHVVTPVSSQAFYTEKLCRLPETYQCNDNQRMIASNEIAREEYKLPVGQFVFCCFNSTYKIDRQFFTAWVEILKRVEHSVLWILNPGKDALVRMHAVMNAAGVSQERLIVAEKENPPIHLRRLELFADVALDTRIVNGHTTTSDALWAGVPVVTLEGKHFNSRVSSSLLKAIGLPDLICHSVEEYIDKAVRLANDKNEYHRIKETLLKNRVIEPLFDTERITRHIELAYVAMVDNQEKGECLPIDVPALPKRTEPFIQDVNRKQVNRRVAKSDIDVALISKYFETSTACPVCNSASVKKVADSNLIVLDEGASKETTVEWFACTECTHHFKSSVLIDFGALDKRYHDFYPIFDREVSYSMIKEAKTLLRKPLSAEVKILSVYPTDENIIATGVEFGFPMSAVVRKGELDQFKKISKAIIEGDFLNLNFNGAADVVYLGRTLELCASPRSIVEKAGTILDGNGLLAVQFANTASHSWQHIDFEAKQSVINNALQNHLYKLRNMNKLMDDMGFELLECNPIMAIPSGVMAYYKRKPN